MDGDGTPSLVALRDRREEVIQRLSDSFANDLLDVDAFEQRVADAHQASSVAALDALVADLAPLPSEAKRTALARIEPDPAVADEQPKRVLAVFSSIERRGGWTVPRELRTVTVFGNAELDFREARFAGVTELQVRVVFGNLEIIVPPQLAVDCEGAAVFGSFAHGGGAVADPGRPLLRIRGAAVFGNVEIETRLPGESAWDARKRRRRQRREQRRLARQQRHALPPAREE